MKIFTILYSFYGLLVFSSLFIFFSIPLLLGIWFKPLKRMAYWAHHKIARTFFTLIFIPMKIRYEESVDLKKQYVIIANHFSSMYEKWFAKITYCFFKSTLSSYLIFIGINIKVKKVLAIL